jgi:nucleotide-binding universal stress UspA family protein
MSLVTESEEASVVVGVDGSEESLAALDWAARFAEGFGYDLKVVVAWHHPTPHIQAKILPDLEAGADAIAQSSQERIRASHPNLKVEAMTAAGAPGKELVGATQRAAMLVVGTSRTLGSVSSYCAHYAACPVAIIRTQEAAQAS